MFHFQAEGGLWTVISFIVLQISALLLLKGISTYRNWWSDASRQLRTPCNVTRHVSWGLLVTSRPFHFVIWVMNQLKLVQGVGHPYLPCHRIFKSCIPGVEIWEQMRFFIRSWPEEALIRNKLQPVKSRGYEHWAGGGGRGGMEHRKGPYLQRVRI